MTVKVYERVDGGDFEAAIVELSAAVAALQDGDNTQVFQEPNNYSLATGITAFAGGGQASATALTKEVNVIGTCATKGDSVKLPVIEVGMAITVINRGAADAQVFGAGTSTINGIATGTGVPLPAGSAMVFYANAAGTWVTNDKPDLPYSKYVNRTDTADFTASGANVAGAADVVLDLTGVLAADRALTLPTVANLVAAIPNAHIGQAYRLRIINRQAGAFAWTVTTNTGWTLTGTMTVGQNTYRDFVVTLTSLSAAVLQSLGQTTVAA